MSSRIHKHPSAASPAKAVCSLAAIAIMLLLGSTTEGASQQPDSGNTREKLLDVPVTGLSIGGMATEPGIKNPVAGDPEAVERGMEYFTSLNCVGCHAANGAGGMGPALSNSKFIYGSAPANIFLSIRQGRPNGMPSWGGTLPDETIWDLVAYVQSISRGPDTNEAGTRWGMTTSLDTFKIEQVPAEFNQTTDPWAHTQAFSFGQKPTKAK